MAIDPIDARFLVAEGLPDGFRREVERLWRPLAAHILARRSGVDAPLVVGLCGPQGSGKTTGAKVLARLLEADGVRVARLSLDDLYLGRAERRRLAETVHPLLATRGPPGTHDPALGLRVLDALAQPGKAHLPRFDKATDDRTPETDWAVVTGPMDVVLFEGWCVGARPEPEAALAMPVNALEEEEDEDGVWRRFVNKALAGPSQALFDRIHLLVQLRAPSFDTVLDWRREQECKLRARTPNGAGVMTDVELVRFVHHYERLTRWIEAEMPARADVVVQLAAERVHVAISGL